jgi:hypothetical protein
VSFVQQQLFEENFFLLRHGLGSHKYRFLAFSHRLQNIVIKKKFTIYYITIKCFASPYFQQNDDDDDYDDDESLHT